MARISPARSAKRIRPGRALLHGALPGHLGTQQVLFRHHFQNGAPHFAPCRRVDQDKAIPAASAPRPAGASVKSRILWLGNSRPRLMPNSGSPRLGQHPLINFMPGQSPPESCQPPRNHPAIHPEWQRAAASRRLFFPQRPGQ